MTAKKMLLMANTSDICNCARTQFEAFHSRWFAFEQLNERAATDSHSGPDEDVSIRPSRRR